MFIGEHAKDKKLSNVRAASAEFLVTLRGIRKKVLGQNFRSVKREERLGV